MKKFFVVIMMVMLYFAAPSPPVSAKSITTSAPLAYPGFDQAVATTNHAVPGALMVLAVPWQNQLQFNYAPAIIISNAPNAYADDTGTMMISDNSYHTAATAGKHIVLPDKTQDNPAITCTDKPDFTQKE